MDLLGAPAGLDVAQYSYAPFADTLSQMIDGKGQSASYQLDDFGRMSKLTSSNFTGGPLQFTYDARGNLLQKTDTYSSVVYTYDGLDRITSLSAKNSYTGSSVAYTYRYDEPGGVGQLTSVVEPERTIRYGYDAAGRLGSETIQENGVSVALVTAYLYDGDGAPSQINYPSGLQVQLVRDPASREVIRVVNLADGTSYADGVARYPGGPVKSLTFGNGTTLSQTFSQRYEPQTVSSGPVSLGYGMTPAGDVGSRGEGGVTRAFRYDYLDRLSESPSWLAYGYDGAGNRLSETVEGRAVRHLYRSGTDLLESTQVANGAAWTKRNTYHYDYQSNLTVLAAYEANGSVTQAACLRHDVLGRLLLAGELKTGYTDPYYCSVDSSLKTVTARFKYDSRNRRVARQNPASGVWKYTVSDGAGNPLSELELSGSGWQKVRDYVWLEGRPLAQIEYPGPGGSTQGYVNYYHLDQIGLPRALSNQSGQMVWSAAGRPYGDVVESVTADPLSGRMIVSNLRLPGQYDERLLGGVGLQGPYYNWNRWYLPGVGRYLELDPLGLRGQFNTDFGVDWYSYADGNPLRYTDPWGLYGTDDCSYYQQRCLESGGEYYCEQTKYWCNKFPKYPDPDPSHDDDYEGWARCTRQCLQDCDREENEDQDACPGAPDPRKGPWDPRSTSFSCHAKCYTYCAAWGVGLKDKPPY